MTEGWAIHPIPAFTAMRAVVRHHYLHRRSPCSYAFGLFVDWELKGVCIFGTPASSHLCRGVYPEHPEMVIELNRLWLADELPRNSESWFVSRCLKMLPPLIVVSYADTAAGHVGYVYRALGFSYAGWTDMDRLTPRFDYVVPGKHSRAAYRGDEPSFTHRETRKPKVRYWTATGNRRERKALTSACQWPAMDWAKTPPPMAQAA